MILVTGSTGLVGAHLLYDLLLRGYKVKALVHKPSHKKYVLEIFQFYTERANELYDQIVWIEGDVNDIISLEDAFEGVEQVFHAAAMVSFNPYDKRKILDINVNGTANVVNLSLARNIKKLCHVSSIAALGLPEDGSPIDEKVMWKPIKNESAYSMSKYKAEMEVWRGITEGLNAVIVNPSVILGPGNWKKSSASIIHTVAKGFKFYTTGGTGFIDVRDLTHVMITLMNSPISGERFVVSSENVGYKDLFDMLSEALHVKPPAILIPRWLTGVAYYLEIVRSTLLFSAPRLSKSTIRSLYNRPNYSSDKIKSKLNLEFKPVKHTVNELSILYLKAHPKLK
jgi:dihydroflavonol-4-reductase